MLKKLIITCLTVIALTTTCSARSESICPDVPDFTQERLLYLLSHKLLDETDKNMLEDAERGKLSATETRAFYLSLNNLWKDAKRHSRSSGSSLITLPRVAATAITGGLAWLVYAMATAEKTPAQPAPRIPVQPSAPVVAAPATQSTGRRNARERVMTPAVIKKNAEAAKAHFAAKAVEAAARKSARVAEAQAGLASFEQQKAAAATQIQPIASTDQSTTVVHTGEQSVEPAAATAPPQVTAWQKTIARNGYNSDTDSEKEVTDRSAARLKYARLRRLKARAAQAAAI